MNIRQYAIIWFDEFGCELDFELVRFFTGGEAWQYALQMSETNGAEDFDIDHLI